jgi:hypothetical protein
MMQRLQYLQKTLENPSLGRTPTTSKSLARVEKDKRLLEIFKSTTESST